jgi:MYXO-CTERM domain-containing protein
MHASTLRRGRPFALALTFVIALATTNASAAPPAPSGAHPRIWLTPTALTAMKAKLGDKSSWAAQMVANCEQVGTQPNQFADGQFYGYAWGYAAASCGAAWQLTQNATYAANGIKMWTALLNDANTVGDGQGGDKVVQPNDGYGIRYFPAYAAVAYDWLHDAPNAAALVTQSQERFKAWIGWCDTSCYLNTTPGSNYHAGYVFAKALVAVAASGEDDGTAAGYWSTAVDQQYGQDVVANGLGDGGCLVGGDWPEGWEYGVDGVVEYALGALALEEQGAPFPAIDAWGGTVALRYLYAMTPDQTGMYIGGDWGSGGVYANPLPPEPLDAVLAGSASSAAASWAQFLKGGVVKSGALGIINDALGEARGASPIDYSTTNPPLFYVAGGTRNAYARSSWAKTGFWGVLTSAPRLGPDHQHLDSSNFVFTRGSDNLIVDPSPYGSLSSLTSNAMSVDSQTVEQNYQPSQSPSSLADLPWARGTQDGTAAARADLDLAFIADTSSKKTDVPYARRDWTFLPEGEIVTIDRVRANSSTQKTYLRFRSSAASLALSGAAPWTATGTVGSSQVVIHAAVLSSGTPTVTTVASSGDNGCSSGNYGSCTDARFAVSEYSLTIPTSPSLAIHVIDGLGSGESPATVASLSDPTVDTTPAQNGGVIGVSVTRSSTLSYVVASSATDGKAGATLAYGVPGTSAARHVVFDAPEDANGVSTVAATAQSGRCLVSITAGGSNGYAGHPLIFDIATAASGCTASQAQAAPPPTAGSGNGASSGGSSGSGPSSGPGGSSGSATASVSAKASGGCGCDVVGTAVPSAWGAMLAGVALFFARRRRHRS